jgi:hypothetical protein
MSTVAITRTAAQRERAPATLLACEIYHLWRVAFEEADRALADWRDAPVPARAQAYAAYRAAADREDAAARHWLAV